MLEINQRSYDLIALYIVEFRAIQMLLVVLLLGISELLLKCNLATTRPRPVNTSYRITYVSDFPTITFRISPLISVHPRYMHVL